MTELKIVTAVMVFAGIIVNFLDRWSAPRSPWMRWLAWLLGSVPAALYIALDYIEEGRRFQ